MTYWTILNMTFYHYRPISYKILYFYTYVLISKKV